jgi:hypothetical protein
MQRRERNQRSSSQLEMGRHTSEQRKKLVGANFEDGTAFSGDVDIFGEAATVST